MNGRGNTNRADGVGEPITARRPDECAGFGEAVNDLFEEERVPLRSLGKERGQLVHTRLGSDERAHEVSRAGSFERVEHDFGNVRAITPRTPVFRPVVHEHEDPGGR
jgi:hypothetical protein